MLFFHLSFLDFHRVWQISEISVVILIDLDIEAEAEMKNISIRWELIFYHFFPRFSFFLM